MCFIYYVVKFSTAEHLYNGQYENSERINVMRCAIWYYLYNFKNVKNTRGRVLFTFFELYK